MDARFRVHDDGERMHAHALRHAQDERVVWARSWQAEFPFPFVGKPNSLSRSW